MVKRKWNMDYLRITTCLMVIFLHISAQNWWSTDIDSFEWSIFTFGDSLVRSAVPLFFMISGNLFLSREKNISIEQLFKKNIFKMLIIFIVWDCLYAIDTVGVKRLMANGGLDLLLKYIINSKYHLWYLPSLIGVYFLIPILWTIAKYENGKYLNYACAMFFVFCICKNTLMYTPLNNTSIHLFIKKFSYDLSNYCGYFLLGYYLTKNKEKFQKFRSGFLVMIFISVVCFSTLITVLYSRLVGKPSTIMMTNLSISPFIEACVVFILFERISYQPSLYIQKYLKLISKYTLQVYLIHIFVLEHLAQSFNLSSLSCNPILSLPFLTIIIFIICIIIAYVMDFVLSYVPIIKKYLM